MKNRARISKALACVALLLASSAAVAQKTGGSFGGGSFSKTGSGSTGGGTRTGSGSSTTGGGIDFGSTGSTHRQPHVKTSEELAADYKRHEAAARDASAAAEWRGARRMAGAAAFTPAELDSFRGDLQYEGIRWPGFLIGLSAFGLILGIAKKRGKLEPDQTDEEFFASSLRTAPSTQFVASPPEENEGWAACLTVAFDWDARPQLQGQLKRLSSASMDNAVERGQVMVELSSALEKFLPSARYAHFAEVRGDNAACERLISDSQASLRGRYQAETAGRGHAVVDVHARAEEGKGLIVISLMVGIERRRPHPLATWRPLRRVLQAFQHLGRVEVLDVVWSPSEENDRLSSAELEVLYPELERVGEGLLGRVSCNTCKAVFAAELGKCPSCGDPSSKADPKSLAGPCPYCGTAMPSYETRCETCSAFVSAPTKR